MALLLPFCDKLATLWVPIGMSPMPAIKSVQWLSPRVKFGKREPAAVGAYRRLRAGDIRGAWGVVGAQINHSGVLSVFAHHRVHAGEPT